MFFLEREREREGWGGGRGLRECWGGGRAWKPSRVSNWGKQQTMNGRPAGTRPIVIGIGALFLIIFVKKKHIFVNIFLVFCLGRERRSRSSHQRARKSYPTVEKISKSYELTVSFARLESLEWDYGWSRPSLDDVTRYSTGPSLEMMSCDIRCIRAPSKSIGLATSLIFLFSLLWSVIKRKQKTLREI